MAGKSKYIPICDYDHFECDIMYDTCCIDIGFTIGSSSFKGEKRNNLFFGVSFLFWDLLITIKNLRK